MRVILNVDAISPPLTGIGRYALALAQRLPSHPDVEECRYFAGYRWVAEPSAALRSNRASAAVRRHVPFKSLALEAYFTLRQAVFARRARRMQGYVLHSPNYLLLEYDGPSVTTVHDLSWVHYPQFHPPERIRVMQRHMPRSLERATFVITDSEFVRREVIEHFGVEPGRIAAVPLGVDAHFRPHREDETRATLERHGLAHGAYVLAVATQEPRKNLERLLRAYDRLDVAAKRALPLVVAGSEGWLREALERAAAPLERAGWLRRIGYVEEQELAALYGGAHAVAFPSLYEGFGLPALEAMASGVPLLTSTCPSLAELVGDAALAVPAQDEDALAEGLARIVADEALRARLRDKGLARVAGYGWDACVAGTVDVYRRACAA